MANFMRKQKLHHSILLKNSSFRRSISIRQTSSFVTDLVRTRDYDNYLCGLLFPPNTRESYFGLRAFNIETASIKDSTRNNLYAGKIRLQWWRDTINQIYDNGDMNTNYENPIIQNLASSIHQHQLMKRWFDQILDARENDLEIVEVETMNDLVVYAENTSSAVLYLSLEILNIENEGAYEAARHAGRAIGLITLLRGISFHLHQGQNYIPLELRKKFNISPRDFESYALNPSTTDKKFTDLMQTYTKTIESSIEETRRLQKHIPKIGFPPFLTLCAAMFYLEKLRNVNLNAFDTSLHQRSPLKLPFQLYKQSYRRII